MLNQRTDGRGGGGGPHNVHTTHTHRSSFLPPFPLLQTPPSRSGVEPGPSPNDRRIDTVFKGPIQARDRLFSKPVVFGKSGVTQIRPEPDFRRLESIPTPLPQVGWKRKGPPNFPPSARPRGEGGTSKPGSDLHFATKTSAHT